MNYLLNIIRNLCALVISMSLIWLGTILFTPFLFGNFTPGDYSTTFLNDPTDNEWTVETVPNTRLDSNDIHVSNPDSIISLSYCDSINILLSGVREKADVFVVALRKVDMGGDEFTNELFNHWGIGDKDKNNGILILMTEDPHFIRIETGYGLEELLTDGKCSRIINEVSLPYFKRDLYSEGLYHTAMAVANVLNNEEYHKAVITDFDSTEDDYTFSDFKSDFEIILILILVAWIGIMVSFHVYNIIVIFIATIWNCFKSDRNSSLTGTYQGLEGVHLTTLPIMCLLPYALISYLPRLALKYIYLRFNRECPECKRSSMVYISNNNIKAECLTPVQLKEEEQKSRIYDVWKCRICNDVHVEFRKGLLSNEFSTCTKCGAELMKKISEETIKERTENTEGKKKETRKCQYCGKETITYVAIMSFAAERAYQSSHSSSSSSGSFGGGSSGGGGASGSW